MILVALDPSIRSCGLALFRDGTLVHASQVKTAAAGELAARALVMARKVAHRAIHDMPTDHWTTNVASEWPQVYRAQRAAGDPNDLPAIAAVGTAVAALLKADDFVSYTPREWAGNLPKATKGDCKASPRAHRIMSRLATSELEVWAALKSGEHDAIDAIGIGLHHLGRRLGR